ncbi:transcriptional regulator domain-containing protein [Xanthobacter sp. TB0139]|uniref:transcriptional regulator domain-containing protein n=1 Tax=Xanthobacter sp. TB0139 TaxID=3459178 RepID=UPI00403A1A33
MLTGIDWRSPAAYRHAKHIPAAGFAWEYLRRNDDYRRDYQAVAITRRSGSPALEAFADRWGLRFPMRPGCPT